MMAAGARGLQTVISIRVQPTEDLSTTLHLSTDSVRALKSRKKNRTNQATKRIKRLNETKQTASEETFIIRAHWSWFSIPCKIGDFVCQCLYPYK